MLHSWSPRAGWLAFAAIAVVGIGLLFLAQEAVTGRDAEVMSFQRTGDSRVIVVNVGMGIGEQIIRSTAVEDADSVRVTVRVRRNTRSAPSILLSMPTIVRLNAPLLERTVLDGTGQPVPDLGDYVGPRPTPTR
ncbi:MAG TPA: hypothetical protein VGS17_11290 [Candidatus Limnocylindria bacterium]|nr:hypothetical protein [Candidatus Limnocylindria bacterium]